MRRVPDQNMCSNGSTAATSITISVGLSGIQQEGRKQQEGARKAAPPCTRKDYPVPVPAHQHPPGCTCCPAMQLVLRGRQVDQLTLQPGSAFRLLGSFAVEFCKNQWCLLKCGSQAQLRAKVRSGDGALNSALQTHILLSPYLHTSPSPFG